MAKTIGADVPEEAHEAFENIVWANKMNNSTLVRKAVDYYIRENPERLVLPDADVEQWKTALVDYRE